ncbi:family 1 glycosylhydrolase [Limnobacter parvus]|uniref:dTDP-4-dehydrorhamnose reductase n=1 Tax=Limnobacter parvus TaxID=2939690 RepID=A0ABT1XI29_9BURK|nr:family 1 glycosylhydrolase [Limnobacter parvus]MCR2746953.1 sugar nucleotide-binding protein [Limnobacter parvus]
MNAPSNPLSLDLWGGVECTVARIGDRYVDQLHTTGHHNRITDLDLFAGLGLKALRYPVLWERIAPEHPDLCDWSWTDARLGRLRELGIEPILTLVHHGSGPRYTSLSDDRFAQKLADFAGRVAERYPWATAYTPVNEPLTTARFSGLYGHWYPHGQDAKLFLRMLFNQLDGIRLSMAAIRAVNPAATLIQTDDLGYTWSTPELAYQADFENQRRWLSWDVLCGRVNREHPLWEYVLGHGIGQHELESWLVAPCSPSVIGVNHYLTSERFLDENLQKYQDSSWGGNGRQRYADVEAQRVLADGGFGPHTLLQQAWQRYQLPLAVTEVHNGCTRDEQMRWFAEMWRAALRLQAEGVDIRAITAWSLLGATDWNSILTRLGGYYEPGIFDIRAGQPRATAMVKLLHDLHNGGLCDHPVLDSPGWWHRADRLSYAPIKCVGSEPIATSVCPIGYPNKPRALLIIGAKGTLGRALARACTQRALPHHLLSREILDISDPNAVERVLADLKPWAVINAAGCVDVDLAEFEIERCWRDNCIGPMQLAETCAQLGIPMLTFSSDLVFDGTKAGAYLETDEVAPLNVYGKSKAGAEQLVLARHSDALIIRTSAFFCAFDPHNFATQTLARLRTGKAVDAVDSVAVSPTYIPDLVNHSIDLLIDGEKGIWHLSNLGSISWYEFAFELANACGQQKELVRRAAPAEAGWIACRPVNSILQSCRSNIMPTFDSAFGRFIDFQKQNI